MLTDEEVAVMQHATKLTGDGAWGVKLPDGTVLT